MDIGDWVDKCIPDVVKKLEKNITKNYDNHIKDGLDYAGRSEIYDVLDDLHAVLFPGFYSKQRIKKTEINFFLSDILRHISFTLGNHINDIFQYQSSQKDVPYSEDQARDALKNLIESLPNIHSVLLEDIQKAYEGDPAAQSLDEIVMSYPYLEAVMTYRIANTLYELNVPIIPRIMSERAHSRTGIDIHPGAKIGKRFFIDHGTGVVIGETCNIGENVKIYQGVTLGALSFPLDEKGQPIKGVKRHPDIEDDVIIYANATILGGSTVIGKGSIIGGNTWITKSVPPGTKIYNNQEEINHFEM